MSHVKIIMDGCKCIVYLLHCRVLPVLHLLKPMLELFLSFPPVVDKWIVRFSPSHLAVLCGREPLRELWAVSPHGGDLTTAPVAGRLTVLLTCTSNNLTSKVAENLLNATPERRCSTNKLNPLTKRLNYRSVIKLKCRQADSMYNYNNCTAILQLKTPFLAFW